MDIFPNECIYSILLFLNPKHLQLCTQINNNFDQLCQLDSLWKDQIEDKYNVLFKKKNHYENCKLYYQLSVLKEKLILITKIDDLYKMEKLDLRHAQFKKLPREIGQLINLNYLNLQHNQLTQLPEEIGQLTNLRLLDLTDNLLTCLPKEIGKLTNLCTLYLNYNELTQLPKEMSQLTNLETLFIADNLFTKRPKIIKQLHNLKKIHY